VTTGTQGQASAGQAAGPEIPVHLVQLWLCALCLDGEGGECHTPGCALWINRAPDLPLRDSPFVKILPEPPANGVQVTVLDTETGDTETQVISDDYVITCAGSAHVDSVQAYANGTHVLTVKGRKQ
jgi:hypothetical protein